MAFTAMTSADKQFLKELDNWRNKTIYAKVVALDFNDLVVEEITGKVTSGSININGTSAVRRTFNLSMISDINNVKINDFYWGLNTKIKLEIGVKNDINPNYPDIIWFNQGIYFITGFSTSITANAYNISINGKDKMCLLDGTLGGTIPSETDFGVIDIYDEETDSTITKELKIVDVIKEAVHFYGKEPFHNIIINDLDSHGFYVLKHADEKPLYLFYRYQTGFDEYGDFQEDIEKGIDTSYPVYGEQIENRECYCVKNIQPNSDNKTFTWEIEKTCSIQDIPNFKQIGTLNIDGSENSLGALISFTAPKEIETEIKDFYRVVKVENGQDFGYDITELTYPDAANGGLKMSAGSTIVALLDKIKQTFGDYEYFYDVNGRFVFQKKRTYINTSWNNIQKDGNGEQYIINNSEATSIAYNFEDSNLISSFGLNPNFQELKNDFVVWGEKLSSSGNGNKLPIHMRYAIDQKPEYYHSITVLYDEIQENEKVKQTQKGKSYFTKEFSDKITEEINEKIDKNIISEYQTNIEEQIKNINNQIKSIDETQESNLKSLYEAIIQNYNPASQESINEKIEAFIISIEDLGQSCSILIDDLENYIGYQFNFSDNININKMFNDFKILIYDIKNNFANIKSFESIIIKTNELIKHLEQLITSLYPVNWRELIYQMAKDYYAFESLDCFDIKVIKANQRYAPSFPIEFSYYRKGVTGYEQYYQEMIAFWRELYNYFPEPVYSRIGANKDLTNYDELYVKERYYSLTVNEALELDEKEQEKLITRKNLNSSQDNEDYQLVNYLNSIFIFYSINEEELKKDSEALEKNVYYIKAGENDFQPISSFSGHTRNSLYVSAHQNSDDYEKLIVNDLHIHQTQPLYLIHNNVYINPKEIYINRSNEELLKRYYRENRYQQNYNEYQLQKDGEWLKNSDGINIFNTKTNIYYEKKWNYHGYSSQEKLRFWNKEVFSCPQNLNFWIDFLDSGNDQINRYSVQAIGSRTKVENNSSIQGIYYEEIPNIIFLSDSSYTESLDQITGYEMVRFSEATKNLFVKSNNFLSAKEQIDTLLYNYGYCTESINITTIPVYYLEPNTRIRVYDEKANINGEYIITQLTVPLTHNGTMNITATKVAQRLK